MCESITEEALSQIEGEERRDSADAFNEMLLNGSCATTQSKLLRMPEDDHPGCGPMSPDERKTVDTTAAAGSWRCGQMRHTSIPPGRRFDAESGRTVAAQPLCIDYCNDANRLSDFPPKMRSSFHAQLTKNR